MLNDIIVSGSVDGTVRLWDLGTRKLAAVLPHGSSRVMSVAFSAHCLVTATRDCIRLWDAATSAVVCSRKWTGLVTLLLSPDESMLIVSSRRPGENSLSLLDPKTLQGPEASIRCKSVALVVAAGPNHVLATGGNDNCVRVYHLDAPPSYNPLVLSSHFDHVLALCFAGGRLFSGSMDNSIREWPLEGLSASTHPRIVTQAHPSSYVAALATLPGDVRIVSADGRGSLKVWDIATLSAVCEIAGAHNGAVKAIAVSRSRICTASADKTLKVWQYSSESHTPTEPAFLPISPDLPPEQDSSAVAETGLAAGTATPTRHSLMTDVAAGLRELQLAGTDASPGLEDARDGSPAAGHRGSVPSPTPALTLIPSAALHTRPGKAASEPVPHLAVPGHGTGAGLGTAVGPVVGNPSASPTTPHRLPRRARTHTSPTSGRVRK